MAVTVAVVAAKLKGFENGGSVARLFIIELCIRSITAEPKVLPWPRPDYSYAGIHIRHAFVIKFEKYSGRTHGGIGCSSSQANCPLTEKELHQLRMDEETLKEMLEEEAMNKKAQEDKIRQEQAENNAFFLEFGVVRYDSEYESSD
ncbi:hypothetical protein Tco_0303565 [Tanacetum coccineum]